MADRKEKQTHLSPRKVVIKGLQFIGRILPHPLWATLVATLIVFVGRGDLLLRSVGMCLVAAWLAVDMWTWLLTKRHKWRWVWVFGATATSLMLIAVMGCMWWWLDEKLKDQEDNVFQRLTITGLPDVSPARSMFEMTNGGDTDIGHHEMYCAINFEGFSKGTYVGHSTAHQKMLSSEVPLRANGGQETAPCMWAVGDSTPVVCADVSVIVVYALDTQPSDVRRKPQRFMGRFDGNEFKWYGKPLDTPGNFCGGPND